MSVEVELIEIGFIVMSLNWSGIVGFVMSRSAVGASCVNDRPNLVKFRIGLPGGDVS